MRNANNSQIKTVYLTNHHIFFWEKKIYFKLLWKEKFSVISLENFQNLCVGPRPGLSQVRLWSRLTARNRTLDLECYVNVVGCLCLKYVNIIQLIVSCMYAWMPLLYSALRGTMQFPRKKKQKHVPCNRSAFPATKLVPAF